MMIQMIIPKCPKGMENCTDYDLGVGCLNCPFDWEYHHLIGTKQHASACANEDFKGPLDVFLEAT